MNFARRAFSGLLLALITLGLIGAAAWRLHSAISTAEKTQRPPAPERSYSAEVDTLTPRRIAPAITAYGQIRTWNSLEIRAPADGPITEISPNFRDGLTVEAGDLLFRIDPELAERRVIDAKAGLAQARFESSEATLSLRHVEAELSAAKAQIAVREGDLARKKALFAKRLTTSTILDDATLAVSAGEQAVLAKEQAVLSMKSRMDKANASIERAQLTLNDAETALRETSYRAPFSGRLTDVAATLGRRTSQNEKLAVLIDPNALEVAFQVRNGDFGHLLDPQAPHKLARLAVKAALVLSDQSIAVDGVLDRTAAVTASHDGRTVYAKLSVTNATVLRPGDFVTVTVTEPVLSDVAVIPAAAATDDGRILLVGANGRLVEHQASIKRRQGDDLIVADVPFGRQFVTLRLPFLTAGIQIKPRDTSQPVASTSRPLSPAADSGDGVALDPARRAELVAFVKANAGMPADRRSRALEELAKTNPSRSVIDRLERHFARRGNRS